MRPRPGSALVELYEAAGCPEKAAEWKKAAAAIRPRAGDTTACDGDKAVGAPRKNAQR